MDMNRLECQICNEKFDIFIRRARNLPCGHGFCSMCINECINKGSKYCPVCRKKYAATSANDLPVSFLFEGLLHSSTNNASDSNEDEVEMCTKHKKIPVYFYDRLHGIKVCHSCAILDHPPSKCNLISLEDYMEEKRNIHIANVKIQRQILMKTEQDFKSALTQNVNSLAAQQIKKHRLENVIEETLVEIDKIQNNIIKEEEYQGRLKSAIKDCQEKQNDCNIKEHNLKSATSNRKLDRECKDSTDAILKCQKWEETQRKDLNVKTAMNIVKDIHLLNHQDIYAQVTKNGVTRASKVIVESKLAFIASLSKDTVAPSSAVLIKEAELGLTSYTTTIFLDLCSRGGSILGRIQFRVMTSRPSGKQFVMLALGTEGATYKGAYFHDKYNCCFGLRDYVTEDKAKASNSLVSMKQENYVKPVRGRVFLLGVGMGGFIIFTKDYDKNYYGYLGDVVNGLEVMDRVASDEFPITEIMVSNSGIVLGQ